MSISYDMALYWDITKICNFDCPQCAGERIRFDGQNKPCNINIPALKRFFDQHPDKTFKINFTGGEPLLVENIIEAFTLIAQKNYIGLITNLVSSNVADFIATQDPARYTYVNASFHYFELEKKGLLQTFLDNVVLLHKKGFTLTISEVAYPFIKNKVEEFREIFQKLGLKLVFNAFRGEWNKKKYPLAYTQEEIDLFDLERIPEFRTDIFNRKGQLCNAGYNSVIIKDNGDAYPCYVLDKKRHMQGNIYEDILFSKTMPVCPVESCTCPFPAFEANLYQKALTEATTKKLSD